MLSKEGQQRHHAYSRGVRPLLPRDTAQASPFRGNSDPVRRVNLGERVPRRGASRTSAVMSDDGQKAVDLGPQAVQTLWQRGKQTLLDVMDFRGFPQEHGFDLIDKIYPKNVRFGKLDPTDEYLASGARIKEWRKIGKSGQQYKIDIAAEAAVVTVGQSSKRRRRGSRRGASVYDASAEAEDFQLERLGGHNAPGSPPRRRSSQRNAPAPETPRAGVSFKRGPVRSAQ